MWNPFRTYRNFRAAEREKDRAVLRDALHMLQASFDAQRAQADAFKVFLEGFRVSEPPQLRTWDDAADDLRFLQTSGRIPKDVSVDHLPADFRAAFQKLEEFDLDI